MILIGLGANLPGRDGVPPRETLLSALEKIGRGGARVAALSGWYRSAPVAASDQPDYVNAVAALETELAPGPLLEMLHSVEACLGRTRAERNAARIIDLDLLDYHGRVSADWPILPHPRMAERAFVLRPLLDLAPDWRHPVGGETAASLFTQADDRADLHPLDV
ncbi:MAG: 2-amino-4-hydroxy-6-hydroxymethyldihydropteridine diphosphokinase [Rhodospirillaceae bacterium]|nr:2-amino-4-hydroxy-6-hydroxymethyldihydropteridine diphosphokinase [Rhodospirillaceae bacterium]